MTQQQVPEVVGIDLNFTPASDFTERDLRLTLPSDILGQARRDIVRGLVAVLSTTSIPLVTPGVESIISRRG